MVDYLNSKQYFHSTLMSRLVLFLFFLSAQSQAASIDCSLALSNDAESNFYLADGSSLVERSRKWKYYWEQLPAEISSILPKELPDDDLQPLLHFPLAEELQYYLSSLGIETRLETGRGLKGIRVVVDPSKIVKLGKKEQRLALKGKHWLIKVAVKAAQRSVVMNVGFDTSGAIQPESAYINLKKHFLSFPWEDLVIGTSKMSAVGVHEWDHYNRAIIRQGGHTSDTHELIQKNAEIVIKQTDDSRIRFLEDRPNYFSRHTIEEAEVTLRTGRLQLEKPLRAIAKLKSELETLGSDRWMSVHSIDELEGIDLQLADAKGSLNMVKDFTKNDLAVFSEVLSLNHFELLKTDLPEDGDSFLVLGDQTKIYFNHAQVAMNYDDLAEGEKINKIKAFFVIQIKRLERVQVALLELEALHSTLHDDSLSLYVQTFGKSDHDKLEKMMSELIERVRAGSSLILTYPIKEKASHE